MDEAQNDFFYFGLCHVCKTDSEELKRCSSCKTIAYCSREHQKSDWRRHRELCRVISATTANSVTSDYTWTQWKDFRVSCQNAWSSILKRSLRPYEAQIWMFPRACNVCRARKNLTMDCPKCRNVAYCSKKHHEKDRSHHDTFCEELKLCMDLDKYLIRRNSYPEIYLRRTFDIYDFPEDINDFLLLVDEGKNCDQDDKLVSEQVLKADAIAPGAIILYTLIKASLLFETEKLIIHIVGASSVEGTMDWTLVTELMFHFSKNLGDVTYVFVGPEAWDDVTLNPLCDACQNNRKTYKTRMHVKLYHEVVDQLDRPDLVVSFNAGLHEFEGLENDQWVRTIPSLVRNVDVPLAITAYTKEEMEKDLRLLEEYSESDLTVLYSGRNFLASPRPMRDWCTENIPVFYSSGYISIIKRE